MKWIVSILFLCVCSAFGAGTSNVLFTIPLLTLDTAAAIDVGSNLRTNAAALSLAYNRPAVDSSHVLWMAMTNGANTNVTDAAGNGNGIITTNASITPYWVRNSTNAPYGSQANALQFDNGQQLSLGNNLLFEKTQKLTVWSAIKTGFKVPGASDAQIIFTTVHGSPFPGYELWMDNAGKLRANIMNNSSSSLIAVQGSTDLTDNTWRMVAYTYDGSATAAGVTIYVAGTAETPSVLTDNLVGSSVPVGPFLIGNQWGLTNAYHFRGMIGFFAVETTNHTAAYIQQYSTNANLVPPITTNTCLYLAMNDSGGTTVADTSTNAYTCTLNNNSMWVSGTNSIRAFMADTALNYSRTDAGVVMSDNAVYDLVSNYTVSAWANSSEKPMGGLFQRYNSGAGGWFLSGYLPTTGSDQFWVANAFRNFAVTNDPGWHHYVVRFTAGGTLDYVVDGVTNKTLTGIPNPVAATGNPLKIGDATALSAYWNGSISLATVSKTNRTQAYIAQFSTRFPAAGIATGATNMSIPYRVVGLAASFATPSNSVVQYRIGSGTSAGAATTDAAAQSWASLSASLNTFKSAGQFLEVDCNFVPSTDTLKMWTPTLTNLTVNAYNPRRATGFF